jgi:hypothetical protein
MSTHSNAPINLNLIHNRAESKFVIGFIPQFCATSSVISRTSTHIFNELRLISFLLAAQLEFKRRNLIGHG